MSRGDEADAGSRGSQEISSGTTAVYKAVFLVALPALGLLGIVAMLFANAPWGILLGAAVGLPLVYAWCYFFLIDLADEVLDLGNRVRVRRGGKVEEIVLDDVRAVRMKQSSRPGYVVLHLSRRSREFGDRVMFLPRLDPRLNPLRANRVVADLETRIARRARAR